MAEATYHGKPCRYGHGTLRRQANNDCIVCDRERSQIRMARKYDALTGPEFSALLLKRRRTKALARIRKRTERRASGPVQTQKRG